MPKKIDCRLKINKSKKSCLRTAQKNKTQKAYNNYQKALKNRLNEISDKKEEYNNLLKKKAQDKSRKSTKKTKSRKTIKKSTKKSKSRKTTKKVGKCFANKVVIKKSTKSDKKYMAIFTNNDKSKKKTIHFGANGMSDYTIHKDKDRMNRYLNRHRKRENWEQCDTAGALSRWILWNKPTLQGSIKDYKKKFNLK